MKPPRVDTPVLTVAEAMAYLKVKSRTTLYRLIDQERLPFFRLGRTYRFDKTELDTWLRRRRPVVDVILRRA